MCDLDTLQQRIGRRFQDVSLLQLAMTHPSVAHGQQESVQHNQRLEFLGDAVLSVVLTNELYQRFPSMGEGPLTKARAHMVNGATLAAQAERLGIGDCLIMSFGEESNGGRTRASALADAFEALLGALYLDGGLDVAREFILRCFKDSWGHFEVIPEIDNPKGRLQELLQSTSNSAPRYRQLNVSGPDHDRVFECAVFHVGTELGRGRGKNKKAAESEAAIAALKFLREKERQA